MTHFKRRPPRYPDPCPPNAPHLPGASRSARAAPRTAAVAGRAVRAHDAFFALLVLATLVGDHDRTVVIACPAFGKFGFGFFFSDVWNPVRSEFGALAPIYGTLVTSASRC